MPLTPAKVDRLEKDLVSVLEDDRHRLTYDARVAIEAFLFRALPVLRDHAQEGDG